MSGRIRSVKPEWLDDERMAMASTEARVLSIALVLLADDFGRGRAARTMLLGRVFPGKAPEVLAKAIEDLAPWFVRFYEVDGQSYFEIRNWDKHQKVDKPGKPRVPPPSGTLDKFREEEENIRASRGSRSSSLPDPEGVQGEAANDEPNEVSGVQPKPLAVGRHALPTPAQLMSTGPAGRADVNRLHEKYKTRFGLHGRKFRGAFDVDAKIFAEAIDAHGEEACNIVVEYAPEDGMVSGRDDERKQKHQKISYIFGTEDTFCRIHAHGLKKRAESSGGSASAMIRRAKERRA